MRFNIVKGICVASGWLLAAASLFGQAAPSISAVNPNSTPQGQPVTVQITGVGFNTCTRVLFRGQELLTTITTVGSAQIATAGIPLNLVTSSGTFPIGVIRYTPIIGTTFTCGGTGVPSNTLPFTIVAPPPSITTEIFNTSLTVCTPFQQTITAASGVPPYTWSASGLPTGISMNAATGVISGTPTTPGQFPATIRVSDTQPASDQVSRTYNVAGGVLGISTPLLPQGTVGTAYNQTMQLQGAAGSPTWAIDSGLPPGLSLNSATGVLSGTPTTAGTFQTLFRLNDACRSVTRTIPITINPGAPNLQITTTSLPPGTQGVAYTATVTATGGIGTLVWSATGLPAGLTMSASTGVISGTPTVPGTFTAGVQVRDSQERTASQSYTLTINAALSIVTLSLNQAAVGVAYSMQLQAAGGIGTVVWSATGLPSGLALGATTGLISGTPATAGSFPVVVQATDSQQRSASRSYTLLVSSQFTIVTASLVPARVGQSYEALLVSSGGVGQVTWSVLTGLPSGLTLNPATGLISGVPAALGDFALNIRAQDSSAAVATRTLLLQVIAGLTIVTESPLPNAQVGAVYSQTISANGGITPFRFLALNPLPPGLTLDPFGSITGTPTQAGTFTFTVQAFDGANVSTTKTFQITVTVSFSITTTGLPNGTVGVFYNQTLSSAGGRAPVRWGEESGQLPLGLVLNSNTGGLTGTPQQAGDFRFTLFALDADQQRASRTFTVTIRGNFRITTETLPNGTVDSSYSQAIATTGGTAPLTFTVSEGSLPPGLALNRTTGAVAGTPTAAGTFNFAVQANDSTNQSARQAYAITIIGPPRIVTESLPAGRAGSLYTASVEAAGGEAPYTFSAVGLPDGLAINAGTGAITGTPTRAASFVVNITVTDRASRSSTRQFTVSITAVLTITTTTLPAGTVGTAYSQALQASGGTGLQWRVSAGSLPAGLALSTAGAISGTPTAAGNSSFTVEVRDSGGSTATRVLTITVNNLTLSQVNLTLSLTAVGPTDQPAVRVQLASPAPATLQGTLTLAFTGVADNKRDAQFSQRDTTFRIPQGQTNGVFAEGLALQIGTVAGTINITAALTAGGVNVTPSPAPTLSVAVQRLAPVITSLTARRDGNTLTVVVDGYSTTREVTSADLQFAIRQGANVQGTSFTVQTGAAFTSYYNGDGSNGLGGMFRLTMPFNVTGVAADITGVSLTLVNAVGRSVSRTANF